MRFLVQLLSAAILLVPASLCATPGYFTLAYDGAWCWFGNPRAVFKDGRIFFGYVRYADGRTCLNAVDPVSGSSQLLWASDMAQRDDHNNPGLLQLSDGRLLAIYAKHGTEKVMYYRVSSNANAHLPAQWSSEMLYTNTSANVTYANPYQLSAEGGKVYNFMRNLNFNPTLVTSDPSATNWSAPLHLIKTGTGGYRPYAQYCSDFISRIDMIYTDGHPDVAAVPTSLYHLFYQAGDLRFTDGTFLKALTNAPLLHDLGERGTVVYQYSSSASSDPDDHIQWGRAWSWDVAYQSNGSPAAVFSVQVTNVMGGSWVDDRIYYYYARWTGSNWQKRFIAHAGRPLYDTQRYYAGGISLDPTHPDVVYLSSNAADPFNLATVTNVPLQPNSRYEIYRGVTADGGLTFTWQAVTTNSIVDNLRPYVPRGHPYPICVLWYAGTYTSYTQWDTAFYGIVATNLEPVTVIPNLAPQLSLQRPSASPLLVTNLGNRLLLEAKVSDDGQPGPVHFQWEGVSGPASAVIASSNSLSTTVGFPVSGVYRLRARVDDSARTNTLDFDVLAGMSVEPANPTAWYKLDELAGTLANDSSGLLHTGTVIGPPAWSPAGVRQGAMYFNGTNGFINVPDAADLDNSTALSLAFWLNASSYTTGGAGLVSKRNSLSDNNAFTTFLQTNGLINVDLDGSTNRFTSVSAVQTGRWYHVAVTFDGSLPAAQRARIYLDGKLERTATEGSPAIPNYNSSLKIGLTHSNATTYFKGFLDDIRLFRRALSTEEIVQLANRNVAPAIAGQLEGPFTNRVPTSESAQVTADPLAGLVSVAWWATVPALFSPTNQPSTTLEFLRSGPATVRLAASNAVATVVQDWPVSVLPNTNVFEDWIQASFPGETAQSVLGPNADPEGDRSLNLLEFALGTDPTSSSTGYYLPGMPGQPVGEWVMSNGTAFLALKVQRPIGRIGVRYIGEYSPDLQIWQETPVFGPPVTVAPGYEVLSWRVPVQAGAGYLRLRVDQE